MGFYWSDRFVEFDIGWLTLTVVIVATVLLVRFVARKIWPPEVEEDEEEEHVSSRGVAGKIGSGLMAMRRKVPHTTYRDADGFITKMKGDNIVAVFDVKGPILTDRRSVPAMMRMFATFGSELGSALKRLSKNEKVKAILLRMNTPGGSPTGSEDICSGLIACKDAGKLTVTYVPEMSASGGVMAMVGSERIFLHPNALTGSVGVIGPRLVHFEQVTQLGQGILGDTVEAGEVKFQRISAGKGKTLGDPFIAPDPEAIEALRRMVDRVYERFLAHVEKYAGIPVETMREKGAVIFDATDAIELGLGHEQGDLEAAQAFIATKLGVEGWEKCSPVLVGMSGSDRFSFAMSFCTWVESFGFTGRLRAVSAYFRQQPVLLMWPHWWGLR